MPMLADMFTISGPARTVSPPQQQPVALPEMQPAYPLCEDKPSAPLAPSSAGPLTDQELREWTRLLWQEEIRQLKSFRLKSWGTAYQTIAEVQLLLRIGKRYRITVNFPLHCVSTGRFFDRNGEERGIEFQLIGSYLNGQSPGTWANKLTFFFAVYDFLAQTKNVVEDGLEIELRNARQDMLSWGVSVEVPQAFLPAVDVQARHRITPLRNMIRQYMVRLQQPPISAGIDVICQRKQVDK